MNENMRLVVSEVKCLAIKQKCAGRMEGSGILARASCSRVCERLSSHFFHKEFYTRVKQTMSSASTYVWSSLSQYFNGETASRVVVFVCLQIIVQL